LDQAYRTVNQDFTFTAHSKLQFTPISAVTPMAPTTFELPGFHNKCYFLNKPLLELKVLLLDNATGQPPESGASVGK
jgi:hypothetical protein